MVCHALATCCRQMTSVFPSRERNARIESEPRQPNSIDSINVFTNKYQILKRHRLEYGAFVMSGIQEAGSTSYADVALIIADYVIEGEIMDRAGWAHYFNVDILEESEEITNTLAFPGFYEIYHAPNPIDVMHKIPTATRRQVCESCLIPTIRPSKIRFSDTVEKNYSLDQLGSIARETKTGHPAKFFPEATFPEEVLFPPAFVIMFQDSIGLNQGQHDQCQLLVKMNAYDENSTLCALPDALSQITALFAHHVITRQPAKDQADLNRLYTRAFIMEKAVIKKRLPLLRIASSFTRHPTRLEAPDSLICLGDIEEDQPKKNVGMAVLWELPYVCIKPKITTNKNFPTF